MESPFLADPTGDEVTGLAPLCQAKRKWPSPGHPLVKALKHKVDAKLTLNEFMSLPLNFLIIIILVLKLHHSVF
jgi:hypothetical protein